MRSPVVVALWAAVCVTSSITVAACVPEADAERKGRAAAEAARRLPAEFERVQELLVTWDEGEDLEPTFARLVAEASWSARVVVVIDREQIGDEVRDAVDDAGGDLDRVSLMQTDRESLWLRDFGPLVVHEGRQRRIFDFDYFGSDVDDRQATAISKSRWARPSTEIDIRLEGGNLLSNGDGVCITTDQVIDDARSGDDVHDTLRRELGCRELIITERLAGEGTGHVDMFALLVDRRRALVGRYSRRVDSENARRLDRNAAILRRAGFEVTRIPMPGHDDDVYRTYTNAVLVNDLVLVPVYNDDVANEAAALAIYAKAFPERRIVAVESSNLIDLAGAIHCVTMNVVW